MEETRAARVIRQKQQVLEVLQNADEPLSATEIGQRVGLSGMRALRVIDGLSPRYPIWEEAGRFGWLRLDD